MSRGVGDSVAALRPEPGEVLAELSRMVRDALSDYGEWPGSIAPNARLDGDLGMQSMEVAALRSRMAQRWGSSVDLGLLLRRLDLDGLAGLTVADVAAWVTDRLAP